MKLPTAVIATRDRYVEAFPLWEMPEGPAAEERARTWTLGLCSQVCFEHGGAWGSKKADPNRPISKDALAQNGATLLCWDMLTGAGSGSPSLVENPDSIDITGQVFVPVEPGDLIAGEGHVIPDEGPAAPAVIPYDEAFSVRFGTGCNAVYAESGAAIDAGMIAVHSERCAWDYYCGGLSQDESYAKHINEFRSVYSLPPV